MLGRMHVPILSLPSYIIISIHTYLNISLHHFLINPKRNQTFFIKIIMSPSPLHCYILIFLTLASASSSSFTSNLASRKVGGRTAVSNVESNRQIQELGKYCIEEYNLKIKSGSIPARHLLRFSRVVAAEKQVVSGFKFYLKILAEDTSGEQFRLFDAVLVVKPWVKGRNKDIVSFSPASPKMII